MEKEIDIIIDDNELGEQTGNEIDETIEAYEESSK